MMKYRTLLFIIVAWFTNAYGLQFASASISNGKINTCLSAAAAMVTRSVETTNVTNQSSSSGHLLLSRRVVPCVVFGLQNAREKTFLSSVLSKIQRNSVHIANMTESRCSIELVDVAEPVVFDEVSAEFYVGLVRPLNSVDTEGGLQVYLNAFMNKALSHRKGRYHNVYTNKHNNIKTGCKSRLLLVVQEDEGEGEADGYGTKAVQRIIDQIVDRFKFANSIYVSSSFSPSSLSIFEEVNIQKIHRGVIMEEESSVDDLPFTIRIASIKSMKQAFQGGDNPHSDLVEKAFHLFFSDILEGTPASNIKTTVSNDRRSGGGGGGISSITEEEHFAQLERCNAKLAAIRNGTSLKSVARKHGSASNDNNGAFSTSPSLTLSRIKLAKKLATTLASELNWFQFTLLGEISAARMVTVSDDSSSEEEPSPLLPTLHQPNMSEMCLQIERKVESVIAGFIQRHTHELALSNSDEDIDVDAVDDTNTQTGTVRNNNASSLTHERARPITRSASEMKASGADPSLMLLESTALRAISTLLRDMHLKLSKMFVDSRLQHCTTELSIVNGGKYLHRSIKNITSRHIREGETELTEATKHMNDIMYEAKEYLGRILYLGENAPTAASSKRSLLSSSRPPSSLLLSVPFFELDRLKAGVAEGGKETVANMILEATHNPYMRYHSFPPLHINLNYLLDPSEIATSREFDPLYDVHKPGPTERRANPLRLPGVPLSHFHPRDGDNMVSREAREAPNESWWHAVKAFFNED